ncbi:MAG: hypothetical protein GQ572_08185 [Gammaproteobacteria bacterium]|jgi:hypothetical protein|nr:hypothetical protein [Gammaproteobacteria bacterium]
MQADNHIKDNLRKTIQTFINAAPIIVGMPLLTSLVITVFPEQISAGLFSNGDFLDTLLGTTIGNIAVGHAYPISIDITFRSQFFT